jgi:hypothetical protein
LVAFFSVLGSELRLWRPAHQLPFSFFFVADVVSVVISRGTGGGTTATVFGFAPPAPPPSSLSPTAPFSASVNVAVSSGEGLARRRQQLGQQRRRHQCTRQNAHANRMPNFPRSRNTPRERK